MKNLNIIDYIIENKKLNQGAISKELKVSQAQISKWKTGEKISNKSELKLIELADLNNVCEEFTIDNADSKWAILTRPYCDGERWLEYLKALVYKHQIWDYTDNDILSGDKLISWMKKFLFLLNEGDVKLPRAPHMETMEYEAVDELGFNTNSTNSSFFHSISIIFTNIKTLQEEIISTIPADLYKNKFFWEVIDLIPSSVINKRLRYEENRWGGIVETPLIGDIFESIAFQHTYSKKIDALLEEFEFRVRPTKIELDWNKLSSLMCGAVYIQERKRIAERKEIKKEARKLILASEKSGKTQVDHENFKNNEVSSNQSDDIDKDDSDKYLSLSERKIMDKLNSNEKLLQELHKKIDLLNSENNDDKEVPF
ncbi:MAG: hypothetical protein ACJ0G6_04630 [Candidatus Pseudothioglobus sp.]